MARRNHASVDPVNALIPEESSPWRDGVPPDVSGAFLAVAAGLTVVTWIGRDPGASRDLFTLALATACSLAAWSASLVVTNSLGQVARVGLATVASASAVALVLATGSARWMTVVLVGLLAVARLERSPDHRLWRHIALVVAVLSVAVTLLF